MENTTTVLASLQQKLEDGILDMLEMVIEERKRFFDTNPHEVKDISHINGVISKYGNQNAVISAGAGLIPGPAGMLAVAPEVLMIIRNQMLMICDLGVMYGKSKVLTKELVMEILFTSSVGAGIGIASIEAGKMLISKASKQLLQKILKAYAKNITQKAIASAVSKWLPLIGAGAMAIWAKYSTSQVGKKASDMFMLEIVLSNETIEDLDIQENITPKKKIRATKSR